MATKVPAADATLRILTLLAQRSRPVPASRIAAELELPRSTTYDVLGVLAEHGYVLHYREDKTYGLGTAAYELSAGYTRQAPLARLGNHVVNQLVDGVGESAHLAVLQGREILYVVESRAAHRPSLVTDQGVRLPAHLTASGRAILSALPDRQLVAVFAGTTALESRVGGAMTFPVARALADARDARDRGWAEENGEVTPGFRSIAKAVVEKSGWPVASIAVTWQDGTAVDTDVVRTQLGAAVRRLEAALG
ncbi:IclR family transcriptional regulator [Helcobacillus massiliensis]|uniref:DNA-binding IclR family transcriptional regulator n=1 Tax=Helcobacillus massiliensis TaxID=521392 RepID=A0A839R0V7_9MICO|nr:MULTISPECIES: IclR family transcriptional regulator [Helcobacillus]MBB3023941.1 DNA-binding IclR family transcriptional regulator [Helcobacillus massiliensis]MCG7428191.1 IclR family transcriptional regulator [Helcobacillus sp. ACRRO]MCT1558605.1 IclR family transcriptional regulator [Helcobacillus massiliensis]MCT2037302.1 IclR family transcriptional regulator [Helcobacillus massiliensis]MCT2332795.1 IclR family transcriptional regulator [Helcobacillus massiliensis]